MTIAPSAGPAGTIDVGGDLTVARMGFGAMRITGAGIWGQPPDPDEAKRVLRRAVELGINFIDTADSYGPGGQRDADRRGAGAVPGRSGGGDQGGAGAARAQPVGAGRSPGASAAACEGSLRRLGLDQIPLYQFHRPDPSVPLAESIGALVELKSAGKIRHIGVSNMTEDELKQAQSLTPVVSVQNRYNVSDRSSEGMVDLCEQEGIVFIPYSPIQQANRNPGVAAAAKRHGASSRQIALAWMMARSPQIAAHPGPRDPRPPRVQHRRRVDRAEPRGGRSHLQSGQRARWHRVRRHFGETAVHALRSAVRPSGVGATGQGAAGAGLKA